MTYKLAVSLAHPVVRGWLSQTVAEAHLLAADVGAFRVSRHLFRQELERRRMALAIERHHAWLETRHGR